MKKIAIVDYGLANIRSVQNALNCFQVEVHVAETGSELAKADAIILPGVGSFDAGMQGLRERGHEDVLSELVMKKKVPFMGICLGLHFIFESSSEGTEKGLGWLPGELHVFPSGKGLPKVPHIGWSDVDILNPDGMFRGLRSPYTFYFVHSYHLPMTFRGEGYTAATCDYGVPFVAAVEYENIFATQFHPEKSQLAGMKLIENFLESV